MDRTIIHVDMDAFYASIEQMDRPEWKGKPVVVGAPPNQRGVVSAASYEAREFGIRSAMPSSEAGRRCPHAIFAPVRMMRYRDVSDEVFAIFERFTPYVEKLSIDEAFLDVSGAQSLFGDGPTIAETIRTAIREEIGITASAGVAGNKFLAKLASDIDKPDGLTVVPRAHTEIAAWLAPMPVRRIWGVGAATQQRLAEAGIHTIGDLQNARTEQIARCVGPHAADHLQALAFGEDERDVELEHDEKSISREYTFPKDCSNRDKLESVLRDLADDVGAQLRQAGKFAGTGQLKLRWKGFHTITRQTSFASPCCDDISLRELALQLFKAEELIKPVRLIGFGVTQLTAKRSQQMDLFSTASDDLSRRESLSRTVDQLRERFGDDAVTRGDG